MEDINAPFAICHFTFYISAMFFSIIIPLYNRPQEIDELLLSLTKQTYLQFEVLVIEDGSTNDAKAIVASYADQLDIKYFVKPNAGQGFARNFGFERAKGDYFVNELAKAHFEGGGHAYASGGISSESLEKAVEKFVTFVKDFIPKA